MELNDKVTQLEDEIKILKNEVQAVLLDLRESCLKYENPFNPNRPAMTGQPTVDTLQSPVATEQLPALEEEQEDILPEEDRDSERFIEEDSENILVNENRENGKTKPEKLTGEDEPVVTTSGSNGSGETDREEVNGAWHSETGGIPRFKTKEATTVNNGSLDLANIEILAQWVDKAVDQLGHERTRNILDITATIGYLPPDLKNILVRFIHPGPFEHETRIKTQDYLSLLIELNGLLGTENKTEVALLYILCQEDENR